MQRLVLLVGALSTALALIFMAVWRSPPGAGVGCSEGRHGGRSPGQRLPWLDEPVASGFDVHDAVARTLFVYTTTPDRGRERFVEFHRQSTFAEFLAAGVQVTRVYVTRNDTTLPVFPAPNKLGIGPHDRVFIVAYADMVLDEAVNPEGWFLPSEQRQSLGILLAHQLAVRIGFNYSYMLWADDDTFWGVRHVLQSLVRFAPRATPLYMPIQTRLMQGLPNWAISDTDAEVSWAMWMGASVPAEFYFPLASMGCVYRTDQHPGDRADERPLVTRMRELSECFHPYTSPGAPCTLDAMDWCGERNAKCRALRASIPDLANHPVNCPPAAGAGSGRPSRLSVPWDQRFRYSLYGGTGAVFSSQLIALAEREHYAECVLSRLEKGDILAAQCLQDTTHVLPSYPDDLVVEASSALLDALEGARRIITKRSLVISRLFHHCVYRLDEALSCHIKANSFGEIPDEVALMTKVAPNIVGDYAIIAKKWEQEWGADKLL